MRKKHLELIRGEKKEGTPFKKFMKKTAVSLLIIFIVFFLARAVFLWGYGMAGSSLVKTVVTEEKLLEEKVTVEGVIIRDEKVVTSPQEGYLVWALEEGARVGVGHVVAEIVSRPPGDIGESRESEVPFVDNEEQDLQDKKESDSSNGRNGDKYPVEESNQGPLAIEEKNEEEIFDPKEIEYRTSVLVNRLRRALSEGDMEKAGDYYARLKDLSQEQLIVHSSLHSTSSKIISPFSGIVSYYTDGLEDFFQPALIQFLSSQQLGFFEAEAQKIDFGERIGRGLPIFKIVDNYIWYFTASVTPSQGEILKEKRRVSLRFDFVSPHDTRVEVYHIEEEEDKTLVTFKINEQLNNFYIYRQVKAEVIYDHLKGVTVPKEALITKEEETGVYTIERAMVRFRPVKVKRELEEELVVEGLPAGRVVIYNPRFFREGQYISSLKESQER